MTDPTMYISIDVETDGPIPGPYSMLQFGAAAFDLGASQPREAQATFKANLERLAQATQSPATMEWWASQGGAYEETRQDLEDPETAMRRFVHWCKGFANQPVLVGYPVTFDFMFVYWYTIQHGGLADGEPSPFGFQGLDLKTKAAQILGLPFHTLSRDSLHARWFEGAPEHSHDGLDDAVEQGVLFVNMVLDGR